MRLPPLSHSTCIPDLPYIRIRALEQVRAFRFCLRALPIKDTTLLITTRPLSTLRPSILLIRTSGVIGPFGVFLPLAQYTEHLSARSRGCLARALRDLEALEMGIPSKTEPRWPIHGPDGCAFWNPIRATLLSSYYYYPPV
ncbi:hypothetical protein KC338_g182 [Hortaea werneckii]|nr:hypothetical protein KC338_g182 [Hortaea werneckii]